RLHQSVRQISRPYSFNVTLANGLSCARTLGFRLAPFGLDAIKTFFCNGARDVSADEILSSKLDTASATARSYARDSAPTLPSRFSERVNVDAYQASRQYDFDERSVEDCDYQAGEDGHVPLPGFGKSVA